MLNPNNIPPVDNDEMLARYVFPSKAVRNDGTVKPDVFIPYKHRELSVTRHREATDAEIWKLGQQVAVQTGKTLRGRMDIKAKDCYVETLTVVAKPRTDNPNHADIEGWPPDKESQKELANRLAAECVYVEKPQNTSNV